MSNIQLLSKIKAISFDLDDTFWDCEPVIVRAEQVLLDWMHEHHPDVIQAHPPEQWLERRKTMYTTHAELACDVTEMRKAFLMTLFDMKGRDPEEVQLDVERAFDVFYRARSQVVLYEGTHELLNCLKSKFKLAAITNGNADLDLIGLAPYFDDILAASKLLRPKPDVYMFQECCRAFSIEASELLHIGDNPQTDVLGGHNAGARTVWFNREKNQWPDDVDRADFEVSSLPELQQLLS